MSLKAGILPSSRSSYRTSFPVIAGTFSCKQHSLPDAHKSESAIKSLRQSHSEGQDFSKTLATLHINFPSQPLVYTSKMDPKHLLIRLQFASFLVKHHMGDDTSPFSAWTHFSSLGETWALGLTNGTGLTSSFP